jgi:methionyl-tRNA formyltransferase
MKKVLILSDNCPLLRNAIQCCKRRALDNVLFACSPITSAECETLVQSRAARKCDIKAEQRTLLRDLSHVISLHCRQVFPAAVVSEIRCINFHPGFNPYNRGWFPHVFSMINGKPAGITIHEMDEEIDHGPIIYQEGIEIGPNEVSQDVYTRIIEREKVLFDEWIERIISNQYEPRAPGAEGNYNSKKDFEQLKELRLDQTSTAREHLNYLRAMSFSGYKNAWFHDKNGKRWFVSVRIEPGDGLAKGERRE